MSRSNTVVIPVAFTTCTHKVYDFDQSRLGSLVTIDILLTKCLIWMCYLRPNSVQQIILMETFLDGNVQVGMVTGRYNISIHCQFLVLLTGFKNTAENLFITSNKANAY